VKSKKQKPEDNQQSIVFAAAASAIEERVRDKGCTDDCDNCKLAECAREGTAAIVGDMGDITFLK
jgi:hypothetical protein